MYSEPWARLIRSMMPNTSVSPAASRNSIRPNCRLLSNCSSRRIPLMRARSGGSGRHLALADVRIGMVFQHAPHELVGHAALGILDDFAQVVVLDGIVVGIEPERAPDGFEGRRFQRLAQRILVLQVAVHLA